MVSREHGDSTAGPGQLDFAVNVYPEGPPDWLREAMARALARVDTYPDDSAAVDALAERHGRDAACVLPTNGSADAMWTLAAVLRPRLAAVVHPSFTEPEAALRAFDRAVHRVFRDAETFALEPGLVPREADLVVVCNPNNPTGTLDAPDVLLSLARPGRTIVVDEAFMDFVPGEAERRCAPGLVVLRSATKIWSVPGIRAGYMLAAPALVTSMREARQPWPVNTIALEVLLACVRHDATPRARRIAQWREGLTRDLHDVVRVWPSAANFVLARIPDGRRRLADAGIAVRGCETFPGLTRDHVRIAVRTPHDNAALVDAIRRLSSAPAPARST